MSQDPRETIATTEMSRFQIMAVAIAVGLNALDGFDVLAISFASPGIAAEWGINRAELGFVLAMELIGMGVGSILIGGIADRIGRRLTILGCLVTIALGMFMCVTVTSIDQLLVWRLLTGLGIGGMLASIAAMGAEYSNVRNRDSAVALVAAGYPIGAVIGGTIASVLLNYFDWRSVFILGGIAALLFIPLVLWRLPESISFLCNKQPRGALERVNATLAKMGKPAVESLPPPTEDPGQRSIADIFRPGMLAVTVIITTAYFLHIFTFYFTLKWIPKIVSDMGFTPSSAAAVLVWANVGGAIGSVGLGMLARWLPVRMLTILALVLTTAAVVAFGQVTNELARLSLASAAVGFCSTAGVVGLYALMAKAYPTYVRASGTGFVIGIGRAGAALSPIVAGYLFYAGLTLPTVAAIIGSASVIGAVMLIVLKLNDRGDAASGEASPSA